MDHFDHGGAIRAWICRLRSHANVRRAHAALHFVARNESGKPDVWIETQLLRQAAQFLPCVSGAHKHAIEIGLSQIADEVVLRARSSSIPFRTTVMRSSGTPPRSISIFLYDSFVAIT